MKIALEEWPISVEKIKSLPLKKAKNEKPKSSTWINSSDRKLKIFRRTLLVPTETEVTFKIKKRRGQIYLKKNPNPKPRIHSR